MHSLRLRARITNFTLSNISLLKSFPSPPLPPQTAHRNYARMAPFKITEISGDLFSAPTNVSLAHCVGSDLGMKAGIAVMFKRKFNGVDELLKQQVKTGGVAVLKDGDRYVYYMVTKRWSTEKPTYADLSLSLGAMRDHMREHNVKQLAMPRIGCGIDGLEWNRVTEELQRTFAAEEDVQITVYNFVPQ